MWQSGITWHSSTYTVPNSDNAYQSLRKQTKEMWSYATMHRKNKDWSVRIYTLLRKRLARLGILEFGNKNQRWPMKRKWNWKSQSKKKRSLNKGKDKKDNRKLLKNHQHKKDNKDKMPRKNSISLTMNGPNQLIIRICLNGSLNLNLPNKLQR